MALDGVVLSQLKLEFEANLVSKKIYKIIQYNIDTIVLNFNDISLLLSANPTYPRLYLSNSEHLQDNKTSNFYASLKRYLQGAIVKRINQPNLDRVLIIEFNALNDFKEPVTINLIIELMGKYSNIILTDEKNVIIDSMKHITNSISSVRMVMPKVKYELPQTNGKLNLLTAKDNDIEELLEKTDITDLASFISSSFIGISKPIAMSFAKDKNQVLNLENLIELKNYISNIKTDFNIFIDENNNAKDFYIQDLSFYASYDKLKFDTISSMLEEFYSRKANENTIKQKTSDIKNIINNHLSKAIKKKNIHTETIASSKNCDIFKVYGDLIFSNIYNINKGDTEVTVLNFYEDNKKIKIPLDKDKTPSENANFYYKKFNKSKSSLKHSIEQLKEIDEEIIYIESLLSYLDNALTNDDITNLKDELIAAGYIKKHSDKKKKSKSDNTSKPYHFISSDGFDIYVGKNNMQNDEVTFKIGKEEDIWMHAKDMPGSHVIIKANKKEVSLNTLNEASQLATFFSKGRESSKVDIDYTERKFVRKPNGAKPGFVIYLNNKTFSVTIDKQLLHDKFNIIM